MAKKKKNENYLVWILSSLLLIAIVYSVFISFYTADPFKSVQRKLSRHDDLLMYKNQFPRLTYVTQDMLSDQTGFLAQGKEGDYIVEYNGATVLYRASKNEIVTVEQIVTLPNDFYQRLYGHTQLENFVGVEPGIIFIANYNMEQLKQQIVGLNDSFLGDYILNYNTFILIYDYKDDNIKSIIPLSQPQLPADGAQLFEKLKNHEELADVLNEVPEGGMLDQETLDGLKESNPQVYGGAVVGDFVLKYSNKLIIYNYERDEIKNLFVVQ